ncbi:hypothetical protein [Nocardioides halotolerans]|uniref:hypothetical protein n=1 Tax=Nocardioides halotolerans TaxID=433660 RepID=UPI0012F9F82E|nr:hypothetical protein [Nocardioides halotolerans]
MGSDDHDHPKDLHIQADGSEEYRGPWVVESDDSLNANHSGTVCVHEGATFQIGPRGTLSGSLTLQSGSTARIDGKVAGSLTVASGAIAEITGDQSGSVTVDRGGLVRVHPGGKLAGSLVVAGLVENRGVRGGSVQIRGGEIQDLDGGSEKQPTRTTDGSSIYVW